MCDVLGMSMWQVGGVPVANYNRHGVPCYCVMAYEDWLKFQEIVRMLRGRPCVV